MSLPPHMYEIGIKGTDKVETWSAGVFRHNPGRYCTLWIGGIPFKDCIIMPDEEGNCYVNRPGKKDDILIYNSQKPDDYADNQKYSSMEIYPINFLLPEEEKNTEELQHEDEETITTGTVADYGLNAEQQRIIRKNGTAGMVGINIGFIIARFINAYAFCSFLIHGHAVWAAIALFVFVGASITQERIMLICRIILRNKK